MASILPPLGGSRGGFLAYFSKNTKTLDFEYLPSGNHGFVGSGCAFLELFHPKFHQKNAIGTKSAQKATKININRLRSAPGRLPGRKKKLWNFPKGLRENFLVIFCPSQKRTPPRGGGCHCVLPLHFGSLFLKIAAGASAGCKNRGVQGFRGHSWGWGEKLKLLQQQASLLFKASLREA